MKAGPSAIETRAETACVPMERTKTIILVMNVINSDELGLLMHLLADLLACCSYFVQEELTCHVIVDVPLL